MRLPQQGKKSRFAARKRLDHTPAEDKGVTLELLAGIYGGGGGPCPPGQPCLQFRPELARDNRGDSHHKHSGRPIPIGMAAGHAGVVAPCSPHAAVCTADSSETTLFPSAVADAAINT